MNVELLKKKVKKLEVNASPDSVLTNEEIDVVLAVLINVLETEASIPQKGTFILACQRDNSNLRKIIAFDFPGGEKKNFLCTGRGSRIMADNAVHDGSFCGKRRDDSAIRFIFDAPYYLSLEATNGRFLASFLADNGDDWTQKTAYLTIAKALAMIGSIDEPLQGSCNTTFWSENRHRNKVLTLSNYIEDLFKTETLPEITVWKNIKKRDKGFFK